MQRFYFQELSLGKNLSISDISFVHQLSHVLRSRVGEGIVLFNGDGQEYLYVIESITKKDIHLLFHKKHVNKCDPETYVRLYQALPNKYEKIEYILQKGTEIWIQEFIFFRSERSQGLVLSPRKMERFQEILREATEQCGGNKVPTLLFQEKNLPFPENGRSYVLHTEKNGEKNIGEIPLSNPINLFIGPEGGWSPTEIDFFLAQGGEKIHLGERILRTETAGPAVAFSLIQRGV